MQQKPAVAHCCKCSAQSAVIFWLLIESNKKPSLAANLVHVKRTSFEFEFIEIYVLPADSTNALLSERVIWNWNSCAVNE